MAAVDIDGEIVKKKKKKDPYAGIPTAEQDAPFIRQETERFARGISQRAKTKQAQLDQPFAQAGFGSIGQDRIRAEQEFEAAQSIQNIEADLVSEYGRARRGEKEAVRKLGREEQAQIAAEKRARLDALKNQALDQMNQLGFVDPALQAEIDALTGEIGEEPAATGAPAAGVPGTPGAGGAPATGRPLTTGQQQAALTWQNTQMANAAEAGGIFVPGEGYAGTFQYMTPEGEMVEVGSLQDLTDIGDLGYEGWQELNEAYSDPFITGNRAAVDIASDIETFGINKLDFIDILQRHEGEDTATLKNSVRAELTAYIDDLTAALPTATEEDIKFKNKERRRLALAIGQIITKLRGTGTATTTGEEGALPEETGIDNFDVGGTGNPLGFEPEVTTYGDIETLIEQGDLIDTDEGDRTFAFIRDEGAASVNSQVRSVEYLGNGKYRLRIRTDRGDFNTIVQMA